MKTAVIYKINVGDELYVGGTTVPLSQRQATHNYLYKQDKGCGSLYTKAKEMELPYFECIKIEDYEYQDKLALLIRKEHWRVQLNATLNSQRFGANVKGDSASYAKARREKFSELKKLEIAKKKSDYYFNNKHLKAKCERCGTVVRKFGMAQHKKSKKCREYEWL